MKSVAGIIVVSLVGGQILVALLPPETPLWVVMIAAFAIAALLGIVFFAAKAAIAPARQPDSDEFTRGVQATLKSIAEKNPEALRNIGNLTIVREESADG